MTVYLSECTVLIAVDYPGCKHLSAVDLTASKQESSSVPTRECNNLSAVFLSE